jgi:hypothetical protein
MSQKMIDWAFAQDMPNSYRLKLLLVALAYSAGPEGDGKVMLKQLVRFTSTTEKGCRANLDLLAKRGLLTYQVTNDDVTYALNIEGRAS